MNYPIAKTIEVTDRHIPLIIQHGGREDGYVLYCPPKGQTCTVDVQGKHPHALIVRASYVIVRGIDFYGETSDEWYTLENEAHDVHVSVPPDNLIPGMPANVAIKAPSIAQAGRTAIDGLGVGPVIVNQYESVDPEALRKAIEKLPTLDVQREFGANRAPELKIPYVCPVCEGRGLVPGGFYNVASDTYLGPTPEPVRCRSCINGIVWG